jgi:23S rRNA pseudouridine1911/1915/1917 synthase
MKPSPTERSDDSLANRLRERFPKAKTQTLKRMVEAGRVRVNGKRAAKLSQVISVTDVIEVDERPDAARTSKRPPSPRTKLSPLQLVHEDEDVLVVNKPPGLLTSTIPREPRPTALAIVRAYVESSDPRARVGLIHRLDRDAGGLLVFSKNNDAYESLKTQFFKHTVERVYEAVVHGTPNPLSGRIESRLVERADGSIRSTDEHAKGQRAITDYELLKPAGKGLSVIRLTLLTGRKHQIRVHLSERGWPIVGDTVYGDTTDDTRGNPKGDDKTGLMLRAVALAFDHPRTGKRVRFELSGFVTPANKKL